LKLEEDKKKADTQAKIMDKSYKEKPHQEVINFKFFEQIIRKILKKAGYKPAIKKRERDEEQMIEYTLPEGDLGVSVTNDFNNYIKLYLQYHNLLDDQSELELLFLPYFSKILRRLKNSLSKGAIPNEVDRATVVFFKNLIQYMGEAGNYTYLLKTFIMIINSFDPENPLNEKLYTIGNQLLESKVDREEGDLSILAKIQSLMIQAGIVKYTLDLFPKTEDPELLDTSVDLLNSLMLYSNLKSQKEILKALKSQNRYIKFFGYLKERILSTYIKTASASLENPIYQRNTNQIITLENKNQLGCFNVLELIQSFCGNCYTEFQDYLQSQEGDDSSKSFVSIDILSEIIYLFERVTKLKSELFSDPTSSRLAIEILKTLLKLVSGPSFNNQKILGNWRRFYKN